MQDKQKQQYESKIKELEIENARLKGENEILRQWANHPNGVVRPIPITRQPEIFPFSREPPLKRHPDVSPFRPLPRIQKGKNQFEIPMLKR